MKQVENKIRRVGNSLVISIPSFLTDEGVVYKINKNKKGQIILDEKKK